LGSDGSSFSVDNGVTWTTIDAVGHHAVAFLNSTTGWSGGVNVNSTTAGMFKWSGVFTGMGSTPFKDEQFSAYPNPFKDKITIKCDAQWKSNFCRIEIYDAVGKLIDQKNIDDVETTINSSGYKPGIYLYKIFQGTELKSSGKLVCK
jgi:hypothetical protein